MRCLGVLIAMHKDLHGVILLWQMANLKKTMMPEWLQKCRNILFLFKILTYLQQVQCIL